MGQVSIIDVGIDNVSRTGFFCKMSGRGQPGYERKLAWLKARFAEGLQIRMLGDGERGFVEFIPGRFAWRAIDGADDYLVIHCLWVVGKSKGKGFGDRLVKSVIDEARRLGLKGVAMVTSSAHWLVDGDYLKRFGFVSVAASGRFDLMTLKLDPAVSDPGFSGDFDGKLRRMGKGIVVYRSDQCPYLDDAVEHARAVAASNDLPFKVIDIRGAEDVRKLAPTPYGVFAIALDGRLLSDTYQLERDLNRLIVG